MNYYKLGRNNDLTEMLAELEEKVGLECPGQRLAIGWYRYLYHSSSVHTWLFDTETIRPTGLPPEMRAYKFNNDLKAPTDRWRRYRKDEWESKYWTLDNSTPFDKRNYIQLVGDPDLPDEYWSKRCFGSVLTVIPDQVFQWAQSYMSLMYKSETIYNSYTDAMWELRRPATYFLFIENRARYWRGIRGVQEISKIYLPDWAKDVNKTKHGLEDGKLPPFHLEKLSYRRGRIFI